MLKMETVQPFEKLSIRDSAKSLKKYGSTSRHTNRNQNVIKHVISNTDTLQGIALKYGVTMEQIRRLNRLWASDSLFLRESLLIPVTDINSYPINVEPAASSSQSESDEVTSPCSIEDDVNNFLDKIDNSIACTKREVKKFRNSEFTSSLDDNYTSDRHNPSAPKKKQLINNNTVTNDSSQSMLTPQGYKLRNSLQRLQDQQDALFEL
ncbi:hypothetical protein PPYR_14748 [Photinus pyralis]|uniref:LysM domain-containing protein n=1 Tax=Photinus pyralis TaxID=7054 RepID=A0A1Y1LL00_PHOPY|nr:lysM and putative peptidoglycan-binding domain-containing protein 1 [Photinus pyralis]KAB0792789.1 hypothetical protein PPYR_14748 [Photinus pyralis]